MEHACIAQALVFHHFRAKGARYAWVTQRRAYFVKPFPSTRTTIQQSGSNSSDCSNFLTYSYLLFAIEYTRISIVYGHADHCSALQATRYQCWLMEQNTIKTEPGVGFVVSPFSLAFWFQQLGSSTQNDKREDRLRSNPTKHSYFHKDTNTCVVTGTASPTMRRTRATCFIRTELSSVILYSAWHG